MLSVENLKIKYSNINFNKEYIDVINTINDCEAYNKKCMLFVDGGAGTGKSVLLKILANELVDKNTIVCSTTGISASILQENGITATTLHSALGIKISSIYEKNNIEITQFDRLKKCDYLIIDEVSMLRIDLFEYVLCMFEKINHIPNIILFGDVLQLKPVLSNDLKIYFKKKYNGNCYFFNSYLYKYYDFKKIELITIYRQNDKTFIDLLNRLRFGKLTSKDCDIINSRYFDKKTIDTWKKENIAIELVSTNKEVKQINNNNINTDDLVIVESSIKNDFYNTILGKSEKYLSKLVLKINSPVMIFANSKNKEYVNGDVGTFKGLSSDESYAIVELKNKKRVYVSKVTIEAKKIDFVIDEKTNSIKHKEKIIASWTNFPLSLYYACTIHKSQGLTLDKGIINVHNCNSNSELYVTLSRFKTINDFMITEPININQLKNNREPIDFLNDELPHQKEIICFFESGIESALETYKDLSRKNIIDIIKKIN